MTVNDAISVISNCYESGRARELIHAAKENELAAIHLAEILLEEVDDNGELRRHSLSNQAISEAEAELLQ